MINSSPHLSSRVLSEYSGFYESPLSDIVMSDSLLKNIGSKLSNVVSCLQSNEQAVFNTVMLHHRFCLRVFQ